MKSKTYTSWLSFSVSMLSTMILIRATSIQLSLANVGRPIFRDLSWISVFILALLIEMCLYALARLASAYIPYLKEKAKSQEKTDSLRNSIVNNTMMLGIAIVFLPLAFPYYNLDMRLFKFLGITIILLGSCVRSVANVIERDPSKVIQSEKNEQSFSFRGYIAQFFQGMLSGISKEDLLLISVFVVAIVLFNIVFGYMLGVL